MVLRPRATSLRRNSKQKHPLRSRSPRSRPAKVSGLVAQIAALATRPKATFFELGTALARLRQLYPEAFESAIKQAGISRRRAYYLIEVRERFEPYMHYEARLRTIGWTKLQLLALAITPENIEKWLGRAETISARALKDATRDDKATANLRCVQLYFATADYERFANALVRFGGARKGRQLIGQEGALMRILEKLPVRSI